MIADVVDAPWFFWAVGVAVGFPLLLVLLTELQNALTRRGSALAAPVGVVRVFILPLTALLILLVKANGIHSDATPVRLAATVLGFVILLLLLSGFNDTLFRGAPEGSWRKRIPSIFLDVARFVLIAIGLAMILSFIWGANVGGLFAALGVTSIVIGLALQNSVGQIISGLLLLFEQPFRLGDWLDTPSARGRVVEVNWRATHIDTGSGLQVMPNSVLAGASFTNLSRPPASHAISIESIFDLDDAPDQVCRMLVGVAADLPHLRPGATPKAVSLGGLRYKTTIPLRSPVDDAASRATFLRWIWYAARRAGLHLDEAVDDFGTPERVRDAVATVARTLRLDAGMQQALVPKVTLARYGTDETLQRVGEVPARFSFIIDGRVLLAADGGAGELVGVRTLEPGEAVGQTTLTREPALVAATAITEVTMLQIPRRHVEELVISNPELVQDLGHAIQRRRDQIRAALAELD